MHDGRINIFRMEKHYDRFLRSLDRMCMAPVSKEIFVEGLTRLIEVDKNWVPAESGSALYIRPFMYASEAKFGVKVADEYRFIIFTGPVPSLFAHPIKVKVENNYIRAAKGGAGYAKCAGNYGGAMYATAQAKAKGYDQVLWTDAFEHKYVQECGTMNIFFIIGDTAITPDLHEGTILAGVTRNSTMVLLKEMGFRVEERSISIDDVISAHKAGILYEVFGTGTAATITLIKELRYKDYVMEFDVTNWKTAPAIKDHLNAIRYGQVPDNHSWMVKV